MSTDPRNAAGPRPRLALAALAALAVVALAGLAGLTACGGSADATGTSAGATSGDALTAASASAAPTAPVLATVGSLRIAAGYVPQPASPDVAAAYFTVTDTGSAPDTLVSASSDASATTTMHRTQGGAMVMLDKVVVPAGGSAAFTPGADHLMLEGLTRPLTQGGRVVVTLHFATAGTVTVTLPVTGYPTGGGLPSDAVSPLAPLPSPGVS